MVQPSLLIRRESTADLPQVDAVVRRAFGRPEDARLVGTLRRGASPFLSLVAIGDDRAVGHAALSPVVIQIAIEGSRRALAAAGLAPLRVLPEHQRRGIGHALMGTALVEARTMGWAAIFLLGDPLYYARFGFGLVARRGLH